MVNTVRQGIAAGLVAGAISGAPSTAHALLTRADPLEATLAAGTILLRKETRRAPLLASAGIVHFGLSTGWGVVLAFLLPRRRTAAWGALAGLAIAALDLGGPGRRIPRIRALTAVPQVLDHVAYGAVVGARLARSRRGPARGRG